MGQLSNWMASLFTWCATQAYLNMRLSFEDCTVARNIYAYLWRQLNAFAGFISRLSARAD